MMQIGKPGIELIKKWEGCRLKAYLCSAGRWTIGYGHTAGVRPGQTITREQAERILSEDLLLFGTSVADLINVPVTQNQFDALVSLAFNIGTGAFSKSTLLRLLNAKDYAGAADQFKRWKKETVNGELRDSAGLIARRKAEEELFRKGM